VKSRTRGKGTEASSVNIFSYQRGKDDRQRVLEACKAFACDPWIAIYVECIECADLFVLSLDHYDRAYRHNTNRAIDDWKMGEKHRARYDADPDVKHIRIVFMANPWNWELTGSSTRRSTKSSRLIRS